MSKYLFSLIIFICVCSICYSQNEDDCSKNRIYSTQKLFNSKNISTNTGNNYDISYHRFNLEINPEILYIKGSITTYFKTTQDNVNNITFDLSSTLTVDSVLYHNNKTEIIHTFDILDIKITQILNKNSLDSVTIFYKGIPSSTGFGSFKQSLHAGVPIISTLSEPYGSKEWWPCKQSLNDKVDSIDIIVKCPELYRVASNGIIANESIQNGVRTTHWKHRHPIAAYLIAIAVTNYVEYSDYVQVSNQNPIQILNYVFPETLENAKKNTPNIINVLSLYNNLFITYPFANEKYGHAQFDWGGGMEHQTMSFMSNFGFYLMAHELAHQWFGDWVTCGSWKDIWLNEGFATFCEGLSIEHKLNPDSMSISDWKQKRILKITTLSEGSVFVNDTSKVARIFDSRLSYSKAGIVLFMLRDEIGDSAFFKGLRNYLTDSKLAGGYAKTLDLQKHFENTSGKSLEYFFQDWIYGEGFPIYTLTFGQNSEQIATISINQKQSHFSVDFFELTIPIKFKGRQKDTIIYFRNIENNQNYVFEPGFNVTNIEIDPEHKIIQKSSRVFFQNNSEFDNVNVIPNPAKNSVTVSFFDRFAFESIQIYDIFGKILQQQINPKISNNFNFDISSLSNGVYYVCFRINNKYITKKIVKE